MKRIFSLLVFLVALAANGQAPTFKSFNADEFRTNNWIVSLSSNVWWRITNNISVTTNVTSITTNLTTITTNIYESGSVLKEAAEDIWWTNNPPPGYTFLDGDSYIGNSTLLTFTAPSAGIYGLRFFVSCTETNPPGVTGAGTDGGPMAYIRLNYNEYGTNDTRLLYSMANSQQATDFGVTPFGAMHFLAAGDSTWRTVSGVLNVYLREGQSMTVSNSHIYSITYAPPGTVDPFKHIFSKYEVFRGGGVSGAAATNVYRTDFGYGLSAATNDLIYNVAVNTNVIVATNQLNSASNVLRAAQIDSTNSLNTSLRVALAQTNITSANVTGALGYSPQLGSANLSNWSSVAVFSTNGLTGFDAINLTNLQAAQITGLLPMGTVASGLTNIPGPFLTTNTAARYYTYNGNALTNLSAGNLVSGTNAATIGIGSLAVPGAAGFVTANNGVVSLGANAAAAKITLDGTTGGQTNQGALVITNTSQANTFLALAGNQTGSSANVIEYKTNNVSRFSVDSNGLLTSSTLVSTIVRSTGNAGWTLADNPVGGIPGLALNSSARIYWSLGSYWWSALDLALTRATNATLVVQSNVVAMGTITATNGFVHIPKALSFTGFTNIVLDASLGNKFTLTLTTNAFFATPTNLFPMQEFTIDVRQDSVGGRTVTFTNGGQWKFPSGQILTTTTNAGSWSIFSCMVSQYGTNVAVVQTLNFQ